MKKFIFIIGLMALVLGLQAQESTNPSLLRSSKATKALNTVPYIHLALEDSTEVIAITQDVWYLVTNGDSTLWTSQAAERVTTAGDSITISVAGDYMATLTVNYLATAADSLHIRLAKNHVGTVPEVSEVSIGTEDHALTFTTLLPNLVVGDDIKPQIMNSNGNDDCTILGGSLVLWLIRYD